MFLIDTITVIPSRMARKLVSSWLLRSKISRKTSVRNRMVRLRSGHGTWVPLLLVPVPMSAMTKQAGQAARELSARI